MNCVKSDDIWQEMGGGWDTFCADNLSDVSGFTTSYSFEIVSLVIRPGTMRSEDKDENGTISTKHNSSLVIPSVIVMTMRRFLTCAYGRGHGELHGGRHGGGQGGIAFPLVGWKDVFCEIYFKFLNSVFEVKTFAKSAVIVDRFYMYQNI